MNRGNECYDCYGSVVAPAYSWMRHPSFIALLGIQSK